MLFAAHQEHQPILAALVMASARGLSRTPHLSALPSVIFYCLLRWGLVSVFTSAVRVLGCLRGGGLLNTMWATKLRSLYCFPPKPQGLKTIHTRLKPDYAAAAAAELEKLVLERKELGEGSSEGPGPLPRSCSHQPSSPWPPKAVTRRFLLLEPSSC